MQFYVQFLLGLLLTPAGMSRCVANALTYLGTPG